MSNANILYLIAGLIFGAGFSLLALCIVAMAKLGDEPLPEIDVRPMQPPSHPDHNVRGATFMDPPGRRHYQD